LEHTSGLYKETEESFGKVKLSVHFTGEEVWGQVYCIVIPYNKKLFVTLIGLARKEQTDCPLPATLVRDQGEDK
jgi:hypothetical protein